MTNPIKTTNRIASMDILRVVAILDVIILHVNGYYGHWTSFNWPPVIKSSLNLICQLGVPSFFVISGYFFGKSFSKSSNIIQLYFKSVPRLLFVFVCWTLIYAFPHLSAKTWESIAQHGWLRTYYWNLQYIAQDPVALLMNGGTWHLWFITALILAFTLITLSVVLKQEKPLLYLALIAYPIMPLIELYAPPYSKNAYAWSPLLSPIMATAPVAVGWWLSKQKKHSLLTALIFLTAGILIFLFKEIFLDQLYQLNESRSGSLDYLLAGIGIVILALVYPNFGAKTPWPGWGQLTLGVYCLHMLLLDYLKDLEGLFIPPLTIQLWQITLIFLVYIVGLAISKLLSLNPLTRKLVA